MGEHRRVCGGKWGAPGRVGAIGERSECERARNGPVTVRPRGGLPLPVDGYVALTTYRGVERERGDGET